MNKMVFPWVKKIQTVKKPVTTSAVQVSNQRKNTRGFRPFEPDLSIVHVEVSGISEPAPVVVEVPVVEAAPVVVEVPVVEAEPVVVEVPVVEPVAESTA